MGDLLQDKLETEFAGRLERLPDAAWSGSALCYGLKPEQALSVFSELKSQPDFLFEMLTDITAVDWQDKKPLRFEVVYQLLSITHRHRLTIKIFLPESAPQTPSLIALWASANFQEREVFDMFGITFSQHENLRRVLLYDEFVGYPLRKDYPLRKKQPRIELRIPELHNSSMDMRRPALSCIQAKIKDLRG
ncbi:MAG: NADH-quinone oxidoreductase subunit C [Deltaproteobacteria bacterium]|nr:NADH-quinone oxidoreductase subunit C [Deltaproteobacteria bacterium]